jgi:polyhydroxyalkanoate synthesis regulator phasin
MSEKNGTSTDSTEAKESLAKKIWLAGLGAYGQGFDEALEQYNKVNDKTSQLFGDLVKKGSDLEDKTRSKLEEVKVQSTNKFDQRVNDIREKLNLSQNEDETRLERLEEKLDILTDAVSCLVEAKKTKKAAAKTESK